MKVLKKLFSIPNTPTALPIRHFTRDATEYCWEDFYAEAKQKYPVRYFFSQTLSHWWTVHIIMPLQEAWYWFKSNTYKRYHFLDLRQPYTDTKDDYKWGWLDEDRQLLFACFNILVKFYNTINNPKSICFGSSKEDLASLKKLDSAQDENDIKTQLGFLKEINVLYEYWTQIRKQQLKELDELLHTWASARKTNDENVEKFWTDLTAKEQEFSELEENMLIRLIKIRSCLWT